MHPRLPAILLLTALGLVGCDRITGPGGPKASWSVVALDDRVTDAYHGFGFELFRELRADDPAGNVFVSPTSVAFALAMTSSGAVGVTADEMLEVLGLGELDRELVDETNRSWLAALRTTGDPAAELALANSVWYRSDRQLLASFAERVRSVYDADVAPITGAAAINAWVDRATRGRIDEIIDGEVPGNVVAYLINALYFQAEWTHRFRPDDTRDEPFRRADGSTVAVPMMYQRGEFELRTDTHMRMLRLPYGTGRFSMMLALPHEPDDLGMLAGRLQPDRWRAWMDEFVSIPELEVRLPRFEIEWESSLNAVLQRMGMVTPFGPGAEFSAMFAGGGPWIDDVLQKTMLQVDERGTTAAAVTKVSMVESAPLGITFDRPFFLAIYDHATGTVLFLGQIADPTG